MYQKGIMMGLNHQYADEINQMDALIKAYPKSDLAPQAMLEKGNAQALLGKNNDALTTYAALLKDYPKSVEARTGLRDEGFFFYQERISRCTTKSKLT